MKRLLHTVVLTTLEFVYPFADGTKRERLTPWEWAVGMLILVVSLSLFASWILR